MYNNKIWKTYTQQTRGNAVLMLARRLQRRHNIKTTLCQCLVLAGYRPTVMLTLLSSDVEPLLADCLLRWSSIHPTLRWFIVSCFVSFIQSHALVAAAWQAMGQRYRCWASIKPTLFQCFVLSLDWKNIGPSSATLAQH